MQVFAVGSVLVLACAPLHAQNLTRRYFYDPTPLHQGDQVFNLGLSLTLLPEPIVEQEIPAPAIDLQYKRSLNGPLSFYGSFSTNYFTNVIVAGLQYGVGDAHYSASCGLGVAGFAGFLNAEGQFDKNSAAAVAAIPVIRFGHHFENVALSLSVSGTFLFYADTRVGSLEDRGMRARFNDVYVTLALEQPFYGETLVSTGISVTYSRTPYQSWMLFNTFDQYLMLPEFFFAFVL